MKRKLDTDDLVRALQRFGDRYHAVDVFADDLSPGARLELEKSALVLRQGRPYLATVFPNGVVRFARVDPSTLGGDAKSGAFAGAMFGAAIAAANNAKGADVVGGALLGLLVGGLLGASAESAAGEETPRRVFAMQFDPETDRWEAYDGSLQVLRWMKNRLLAPEDPKVA
ncbi:MAG: hypothetical protein R3B99_23815 [Polyangiales bacterium]